MDTILPQITEEAIHRMEAATSPRLREAIAVVIRHLHAGLREVQITEAEWGEVLRFLTRTGQICDDRRQEFILLSDVLGASMLVDAIAHRGEGVTESTVMGPFYTAPQPVLPMGSSILKRDEEGAPTVFRGRVTARGGVPLPRAMIEVWQTAPNGLYDVQDPDQPDGNLRGTFRTGTDGRYSFASVLPTSYPIPSDGPVGQLLAALGRHPMRPAHLHFKIEAADYAQLVTHLFIANDPWLESDAVFGVKPSLIVTPVAGETGLVVDYDFVLDDAR